MSDVQPEFFSGLTHKHPQQAAFDAAPEGGPIWCSMTRKNARNYFPLSEPDAYHWLRAQRLRGLYEILSRPCCYVGDCDADRAHNPTLGDASWQRNEFERRLAAALAEDGFGTPRFVWLDASTEKKFSMHVLVKLPAHLFRSIVAAGAYVYERVWLPMIEHERDVWQLFQVKTKKGGSTCIFDPRIYSINRPFRTDGSAKPGGQPLALVGAAEPALNDFAQWADTLAQHWPDGAPEPTIIEWDGPTQLLKHADRKRKRDATDADSGRGKRGRTSAGSNEGGLPEALEQALMSVICAQVGQVACYKRRWEADKHRAVLYVRSTLCWVKGDGHPEPHRSNNVWFTCYLRSFTVVQRCGDEECAAKGKGYKERERTFRMTQEQAAPVVAYFAERARQQYGPPRSQLAAAAPGLFSGRGA